MIIVAALIMNFGRALSVKLDFFMGLFLIFPQAFFKTELDVCVAGYAYFLLHGWLRDMIGLDNLCGWDDNVRIITT